ncbi:MAG TPA: hypothetical protein VJA40_02100 [archaeon]|nr:hypothetical protein [archaeon]
MVELEFLAFAAIAGTVSFFNPCGFGLLGVYISKYFEKRSEEGAWKNALDGATAGVLATVGFALFFALAGIVLKAGFRAFIPVLPFILLGLAVFFIASGISKLSGRPIFSFTLPLKMVSLDSNASFFSYGILYALGSLGCALPIFLILVSGGLSLGAGDALLVFLSYSLGMGAPMTALTVSVALSKSALLKWAKNSMQYFEKIAALLLIGGGAYLFYYLWKAQLISFPV